MQLLKEIEENVANVQFRVLTTEQNNEFSTIQIKLNKLTLITFIHSDHSTMPQTIPCRCMRAHYIGAFNILRNCC